MEAPLENVISKSVVIKRNMGKYDDIINLPHHESKNHPRMSNMNRAAQFAPFAALVGFSESIKNSEEILEKRIELSEDKKQEIAAFMHEIKLNTHDLKDISVKYFVLKNKAKNLGKYIVYKGKIKRIDEVEGKIIFLNRKSIYIKDIYDIKETDDE